MQYTLSIQKSKEVLYDFQNFMILAAKVHTLAIRRLDDMYNKYLKSGYNHWFRDKYTYEEFLNAITFNTTIEVFEHTMHNLPFKHIKPKNWSYFLKTRTIKKLTKMSDESIVEGVYVVTNACAIMQYMTLITDVTGFLRRIELYSNSMPYTIDDNDVRLHNKVVAMNSKMATVVGKYK